MSKEPKPKEEPRVQVVYRPRPGARTFSPELRPGQCVSVPASEAERLLEGGQFVKPGTVEPESVPTATTVEPKAATEKKGGK
jgi:hypothetical protein